MIWYTLYICKLIFDSCVFLVEYTITIQHDIRPLAVYIRDPSPS